MFNLCLAGIDVRERDESPSFLFKLVFIGRETSMRRVYSKELCKLSVDPLNDISYLQKIDLSGSEMLWFYYVCSSSTLLNIIRYYSKEVSLVVGPKLLVSSVSLRYNIVQSKRQDMEDYSRLLFDHRVDDVKSLIKMFNEKPTIGVFLNDIGMYSDKYLINMI